MKKKMNVLTLAVTFAGCFLGAGYVSGQELWQFFGSFGKSGVIGLVIAVLLQIIFGILILEVSKRSKIEEMDRIIIWGNAPIIRSIIGGIETFFLFGVYVIMAAGAGALLEEVLHIPAALGAAVFCLMVSLTVMKGLKGMVSAFVVIVPILVAATVIISGLAIGSYGSGNIPFQIGESSNPLIGNWFFSACTFVAYNLFGSIGILTPLAKNIEKRSTKIAGMILGGCFLFLIAISILAALQTQPTVINGELPMLLLAGSLGGVAKWIYALLLLGAMFGTSMSGMVAVLEYLGKKKETLQKQKNRNVVIVLSAIVAFTGSLVGFGELIGVLYPICGYVGILALICILIHFIVLVTKRRA